jgi:hypothetical protein
MMVSLDMVVVPVFRYTLVPMADEAAMSSTLSDFVWKQGAPNALFSDNAKVATSEKVLDSFQTLQHGPDVL